MRAAPVGSPTVAGSDPTIKTGELMITISTTATDAKVTADIRDLMNRAQAGDADAFGEIYDRNVATIFRFIYARTGNHALAEDLTSETFLRALRGIDRFTWQGRDPGAWLITIARNLITDHYKSSRYNLERPTPDMRDAERVDHDPAADPEAAAIAYLTSTELLRAVRQLTPDQRECIVLRFLLNFSVAATAEAMNKEPGAIKALQFRAIRALHQRLPDLR